MATSKPPMKPKAFRSKAYEATLGQPRQCDTCAETKVIAWTTFGPDKDAPNGVATTCRACVGRGYRPPSKAEVAAAATQAKSSGPLWRHNPAVSWSGFEKELDAAVKKLTQIAATKNPDLEEMALLRRRLTSATRVKGDLGGGGGMPEPLLAFRAFLRLLRPCMSDWCELGAIHWDDIIPALLDDHPNVVLLASRGSAKSTLTAQYVAWLLWRDPEHETVLVVSRSEKHATKLLKAIRGYFELCPLLRELLPDDDQVSSTYQLEVAPAKGKLGMSTSVTCRGLTGQITGLRARTIIGDDIEGPRDDRPEAVDRLEEQIQELQHIAVPGARVKMLGTPQSQFSLYGRLSRSEAWKVYRAVIFTEDQLAHYNASTRWKPAEILSRWPDRFSEVDILNRQKAVSRLSFALQYRLDLSSTTAREHPFRLADLPVLRWSSTARRVPVDFRRGGAVLPDLPRGAAEDGDLWQVAVSGDDLGWYTQVLAAVDPASGLRSGAKHDAIGLAIVGVTVGGRAVIRAAAGVRGNTMEEAIGEVARLISLHSCNKLLVEEGVSGLFGSTLSNRLAGMGHPLIPEKVKTGGQAKARRIIEAISPALASGKLCICEDVLRAEDAAEFVNQFTGITYDGRRLPRHDDIVDALSYALAAIGPVLSSDEAEHAAAARFDIEDLRHMKLRRCVLNEEELELWAEEGEAEEALRLQIERSLRIQRHDLVQGVENPQLHRHIERLNAELRQLQTNRTRVVIRRKTEDDLERERAAAFLT